MVCVNCGHEVVEIGVSGNFLHSWKDGSNFVIQRKCKYCSCKKPKQGGF